MTGYGSQLLTTVLLLSCGGILACLSLVLLDLISKEQESPFIDEIFHVPQAQSYCRNQWTQWDPKITTLPGLYIVSYVLLKPFDMFNSVDSCSTYSLRLTNLLATVLNFLLAFRISCLLENKYKLKSCLFLKLLTAFNVAIFPPLYFFTFLYYTDVWSTTFVLLMYCMHLQNGSLSKLIGCFAGFMAVLMRQTNIIWVGLMALDDIWSVLSKNLKAVTMQDYNFSKKVLQRFILDCLASKNIFKKLRGLLRSVVSVSGHNILVCVMFIVFVLINKSIVLGDKHAHTATFHPMQNLYFLDFALFFGWPFLVLEVRTLWEKLPNVSLLLVFTGVCAGLSEVNKLEHPYLMADNRHLAFYIWKRVFGHPIVRRMIVPTYVFSAVLLWTLLRKRCHFMFMVMLAACITLNLSPQYLFELRYFIVPFLMCRLQFKQSSAVILETVFFLLINAGVIHLFISRTFEWPSEPNAKQRFIW